ncbi:MAG TPA: 2TM domain-containing protein [Segetibacter sp.]|jgi:hypothetical protein
MERDKFSSQETTPGAKDNALWEVAKKRAGFKAAASSYVIVNLFLIAIWYFTSGRNSYFWPIWSILGWGFGLAMSYVNAYHGTKLFSAEKEYQNLKNKQF